MNLILGVALVWFAYLASRALAVALWPETSQGTDGSNDFVIRESDSEGK